MDQNRLTYFDGVIWKQKNFVISQQLIVDSKQNDVKHTTILATGNMACEWPSSLYSFRQATEVKLATHLAVLRKRRHTSGPMPHRVHSGPKLALSR